MSDKDYSKVKYCICVSSYHEESLSEKINDIINGENVYTLVDIQFSAFSEGDCMVLSALLCFK